MARRKWTPNPDPRPIHNEDEQLRTEVADLLKSVTADHPAVVYFNRNGFSLNTAKMLEGPEFAATRAAITAAWQAWKKRIAADVYRDVFPMGESKARGGQ